MAKTMGTTMPGFTAERSLSRSGAPRRLEPERRGDSRAVRPAQRNIERFLVSRRTSTPTYFDAGSCPAGTSPVWTQTGGQICEQQTIPVFDPVTQKFVNKTADVCRFEPIGYRWECQPRLFTLFEG